MSSAFLAPLQSSHRRPTGSARQRENRIQHNTQSTAARRRKSRSPDSRILEEVTVIRNDSGSRKKKRPNIPSSLSASSEVVAHSPAAEGAERGRRPKGRPKSQSLFTEEGDTLVLRELARGSGSHTGPGRTKRKERSKSHETVHRLSRKTLTPELSGDDADPLDVAFNGSEYNHMKQELENFRKQLSHSKKAINKQSKVIDELRLELASSARLHKEQGKEMEKLKSNFKRSHELVANIESNLTCQICMDLLSRPHGLSPCGHILCQGCLQEWFRSAPPGDDEMYDDDDPESLLFRKKTCPCCRSVVRSRPIPLFLVKSIASTLEKAKTHASTRRPTPPPDDDPWAGIFLNPDDEFDNFWGADVDEDDEDDDEEYDEDDDDDDWSFDGYGTAEDEERYEGHYIHPRWVPPIVVVSQDDYPYIDGLHASDIAMLRRGATLQMIDLFSMSYTHESGLSAVVDNGNTVYLGWTIDLLPDDETGEEYMDWITADMYERPERWEIVEDDVSGAWTAWKLVPEGDEEYDTSDSEVWAADLASD